MAESPERPVVACFCATFLKPEMLHIYRQITALKRWRPIVITRKRENQFPFEPVFELKKPRTHFIRRFWYRKLLGSPWQISRAETDTLMRMLNHQEAKVLHVYFGHIAIQLLPLMRAWARPSIVSFHGADVLVDMEKPKHRDRTRAMLDAARLVLVRSESLQRAVAELGCEMHNIRIHRTGIPLEQFPFVERAWPADGEWRLIQAGRLVPKKGLATTLRAFAIFRETFPGARLTIAGDGPLLRELETLAREVRINDSVTFAGFLSQPELRDLLYKSHLFLHPSETGSDGNQEGVPNSMLEAMATGLPVFATTHGGIPEAIEDNVSGVLVPEGDHASLARALLTAATEPGRLAEISRAARDAVIAKFDQREQTRVLESLYSEAARV